MIVNGQDKEKAILAGKIAGKAISYGKSLIEPDARIVEVLDKVEQFIKQNGGEMAFPAQVSINDIAAHNCPTSEDLSVFKSTDIIKLDLGVHIDGVIADNAVTIVFKKNNPEYEKLHEIKKASEEALTNVLKYMRPGTKLGEIGLVIQETISKYELSPVKNLSGHGLGKYIVHENPTIPNFNTNDKKELEEGQLVAVEPFATNGHGMIFESSNPTLYSVTQIKGVRSNMTREVLNTIKTFNNLPFTTRWLTTKHSPSMVRFALNDLRNLGIIHEYPPLVEVGRGMVAQSEHTVIVGDKPIITTHRDE